MEARLPLITVLVILYNGERYVAECLDSILALKGGWPLQVVVVDDASTDGGPGIVQGYADRGVEYVRLPHNLGAAGAITHAFTLAKGEYIVRLDYDDRLKPDFLEVSVPALEAWPDAAFVCAGVQMIDQDSRPAGFAGPADHGEAPGCADRFINLMRSHFVTAPTILGRAEHWRRAMPVPEGLNACDWYMNLAMAEAAPVVVLDAVTADYRIHPLNMHSTYIRSGDGERVMDRVLARFLGQTPRAVETKPVWAEILGLHRAQWGDRYFGAGMNADARRCYLAALGLAPRVVLDGGRLVRLAATLVGRGRYERVKQMLARRGQG